MAIPPPALLSTLAALDRNDRTAALAACAAHPDSPDFQAVAGWIAGRAAAEGLAGFAPRALLAPPAVPTAAELQAIVQFGFEHHLAGRLGLAALAYRGVLALAPAHGDALAYLGALLAQKGRNLEAAALLARTVDLYGPQPQVVANLSAVAVRHLRDLDGIPDEAAAVIALVGAMLDRFRHTEGAYLQCALIAGRAASAAIKAERSTDAVRLGRLAVVLTPDSSEIWSNLGYALEFGGRAEESPEPYRYGMLSQDDRSARAYAALMLMHACMRIGRWDRFAELLPLKHDYQPLSWWQTFHPAPVWDGTVRPGEHILIVGESGFGDVIQCVRYAAWFRDRGLRVSFVCDRRLKALCRLADGVEAAYAPEDGVPLTDWRALSFDLFYRLERDPDHCYRSAPYIDLSRSGRCGPLLERRPGDVLIGLKWTTTAAAKDLPLDLLATLRVTPGVRFVSLQPEPPSDPALLEVERPLDGYFERAEESFLCTAQVIAQLDLVITADSVIAHLAGAVGAETWVALRHVPDWRWLTGRADSPLYDSLTLFREPPEGGWGPVIAAMRDRLRDRLGQVQPDPERPAQAGLPGPSR